MSESAGDGGGGRWDRRAVLATLAGVGAAATASCQGRLRTAAPGGDGGNGDEDDSDATFVGDGGADASEKLEFDVRSSVFEYRSGEVDRATMDRMFTRRGGNVFPPLVFSEVPSGTETLAIVVRDVGMPDSPVHWLLWNLPVRDAGETRLPGDVDHGPSPDAVGALQGKNRYGSVGYDGPGAPGERHTTSFEAYALPGRLNVEGVRATPR